LNCVLSLTMAPKQRLPRGILPDGIDVPEGTDIMQFCRDLAESGASFAEQFDRNNPNFHGGDKRAVPMGGSRVPESMGGEEMKNWRDLPEQCIALEDDYGEEYRRWMGAYETLNHCKKMIAVVNKPVEVAMKLRVQYKNAEDDDRTAYESRLKGAENDRDGALAAATATILDFSGEYISQRCRDQVAEVVRQGKFDMVDRDTYGEYIHCLKRANQEIFMCQTKILAKIKEAKKASQRGKREAAEELAGSAGQAGYGGAAAVPPVAAVTEPAAAAEGGA